MPKCVVCGKDTAFPDREGHCTECSKPGEDNSSTFIVEIEESPSSPKKSWKTLYSIIIVLVVIVIAKGVVTCQKSNSERHKYYDEKYGLNNIVMKNNDNSYREDTPQYSEEIAELHRAAEQGDPSAQLGLGMKYKIGEEVDQSDSKSEMWLRKSALQGNTAAQYFLGLNYEKTDHDQAMKWFWYAAEQGDPLALWHLGGTYYKGIGVDINYSKAYFLFLLAMSCSSEDPDFYNMVAGYSQSASIQLSSSTKYEVESFAATWGPKSWETVRYMEVPEW